MLDAGAAGAADESAGAAADDALLGLDAAGVSPPPQARAPTAATDARSARIAIFFMMMFSSKRFSSEVEVGAFMPKRAGYVNEESKAGAAGAGPTRRRFQNWPKADACTPPALGTIASWKGRGPLFAAVSVMFAVRAAATPRPASPPMAFAMSPCRTSPPPR